LYITEQPEVRFEDVQVATIEIQTALSFVPIDPHYLEVCEPNSFEVWASTRRPIPIGCCVENGNVRLELDRVPLEPVRVALKLTGLRSGFKADRRFAIRTEEQFNANEKFIRSAYNHDPITDAPTSAPLDKIAATATTSSSSSSAKTSSSVAEYDADD